MVIDSAEWLGVSLVQIAAHQTRTADQTIIIITSHRERQQRRRLSNEYWLSIIVRRL